MLHPSIAVVHTQATRWSLLILSLGTTGLLLTMYLKVISVHGYNLWELMSAGIFTLLAFWVSFSFWSATLGLLRALFAEPASAEETTSPRQLSADAVKDSSKTAILVPVYNESPTDVFARIQAMAFSLEKTGQADRFDIFVLSDTTNPEIWLEEEWMWSRLIDEAHLPVPIFYRRRPKNLQRKAGNIADFCTRWGNHYELMIVLDADSLMTGSTCVEMVRRIRQDHKLAILQVPPRPINRSSFFARIQQFAAAAYSPICIYGFDGWSSQQGNYWGHNAIIRVRPFMQCCELPILPGKKPLGGEILSHDFVEAALLTSAGWKVQLAYDLEGSYEECPTTLQDYLIRDQRWCQGNMQHTQLVISEGFRLMSRVHFLMGVMSYVSSPLWFLFLIFSLAGYWQERDFVGPVATNLTTVTLVLFATVMFLLLLPKLWSLLALTKIPQRVRDMGGWLAVTGSVLLETLFSILIASVIGFYHSCFVINTLRGKSVNWNTQQRDETVVTFRDAVQSHLTIFLVFLVVTATIAITMPELLPWMSPLLAGPLLIFPLAMLAASQKAGLGLKKFRLLLIPEERVEPEIVKDMEAGVQALQQQALPEKTSFWQQLLEQNRFRQIHYKILQETSVVHSASPEEVAQAEEMLAQNKFQNLPRDVTCSVLSDRTATERLARVYQKSIST